MQRGVSFPEYAVLIAGVLVIVSIALAGLGLAYEEVEEWLRVTLIDAVSWISEENPGQSGEERS